MEVGELKRNREQGWLCRNFLRNSEGRSCYLGRRGRCGSAGRLLRTRWCLCWRRTSFSEPAGGSSAGTCEDGTRDRLSAGSHLTSDGPPLCCSHTASVRETSFFLLLIRVLSASDTQHCIRVRCPVRTVTQLQKVTVTACLELLVTSPKRV